MGGRFYQQQYGVTLGAKPSPRTSNKQSRRSRVSEWTDELKEQVKQEYLEADPTPENSTEIVKEIAERLDKSPNGVRAILSKQGVYVKKNPDTTPKAGGGKAGGGTARGSKQANIDRLNKAIESTGREPDTAITEKLTGKAAAYFADVIAGVPEETTEE